MLLASQTTPENPTLWVCHAAIAERLRCSPVTVKRAIQKLVEAKLIVETGDLHERRFKFYRVRWTLSIVAPALAEVKPCAGKTKKKPRPVPLTVEEFKPKRENLDPIEKPKRTPALKLTEHAPPSHPGVDHVELLKDSRIAYWAEVARQKHQENLQRYRIELDILNRTNPGEFGEFKERFDNPYEGL